MITSSYHKFLKFLIALIFLQGVKKRRLSLYHNSPFRHMENYLIQMGVMARQIDKNHFLYLNITRETKEISMKGKSRSILFDKEYSGNFTIAPYEPEFIEIRK